MLYVGLKFSPPYTWQVRVQTSRGPVQIHQLYIVLSPVPFSFFLWGWTTTYLDFSIKNMLIVIFLIIQLTSRYLDLVNF